jgi:hypothetical protein
VLLLLLLLLLLLPPLLHHLFLRDISTSSLAHTPTTAHSLIASQSRSPCY